MTRPPCSLTSHGAAGSTTGSRHLLHLGSTRLLLDCGLYQGRRKDTFARNLNFGFDPTSVDRVILSHAHIDHSGNLPNLVKQGFGGPIHCTYATQDLCGVMLRDSAWIHQKDADWINRRNRKRNRPDKQIEPLYTIEDAERALEQLRGEAYHESFAAGEGVTATFYDAGHILGSAAVILDIETPEGRRRLAFSGDIGRARLPLLRDPEIPHDVDWLVMESTYGAREHDPIVEAKEELRQTVVDVAARGGKIVVPSFAVERTQEIVYFLNELTNEGALPPIPIFVDSPMATNVTEIFRRHPENFDAATRDALAHDDDIFGFHRLSYTRDVEESKRLNHLVGPAMIISASGMCEGGRICHHLRNTIGDPRNCIVFVGYQAQGTLGRAIVERKKEVRIFGDPHRVRAQIVTLNTFSAHADRNDLFDYVRVVKEHSPLRRVFLVHGEPEQSEALGARLREELDVRVTLPQLGETYDLAD